MNAQVATPLPIAPTAEVPKALGLSKLVRAHYNLKRETPRTPGFHPSEVSLPTYCPALTYFAEQANAQVCADDPETIRKGFEFKRRLANAKRFPATLKQEFLIGETIHHAVQFQLGVIGKLWGVWKCGYCGAQTLAPGHMPRTYIPDLHGRPMLDAAPCRVCNGLNYRRSLPWLYVEPAIGFTDLAKRLGVIGHMDGDLREHRDGVEFRYVVEVKSINDWGWNEGKNPKWEDLALADGWQPPAGWFPAPPSRFRALPTERHVTQASIYAACMGITHICFIYVNKNQVSKWKERIVPIDPGALYAAEEKINAARTSIATQTPPLHARICSDPRDETARNCPACADCFGRVAPPNALGRR